MGNSILYVALAAAIFYPIVLFTQGMALHDKKGDDAIKLLAYMFGVVMAGITMWSFNA